MVHGAAEEGVSQPSCLSSPLSLSLLSFSGKQATSSRQRRSRKTSHDSATQSVSGAHVQAGQRPADGASRRGGWSGGGRKLADARGRFSSSRSGSFLPATPPTRGTCSTW
eukprot:764797-Hanusia_phi.AAC.4